MVCRYPLLKFKLPTTKKDPAFVTHFSLTWVRVGAEVDDNVDKYSANKKCMSMIEPVPGGAALTLIASHCVANNEC